MTVDLEKPGAKTEFYYRQQNTTKWFPLEARVTRLPERTNYEVSIDGQTSAGIVISLLAGMGGSFNGRPINVGERILLIDDVWVYGFGR